MDKLDLQEKDETAYQRRKVKKAEAARRRRARMSEKDKAKRNEYQRKRRSQMWGKQLTKDEAVMNDEEIKKLRIKNIEAHRKRRANMTEEELKRERLKNAEYQREKRAKLKGEELKKVRRKNVENERKRTAKMNEKELERFKKSRAEYQRQYRQQLRDGPVKLQTETEVRERIRLFVLLISGFKSYRPRHKYLAARKFFSNIVGEIGDLNTKIANLKKQLKQSVSDAVQNAVKVHQIKKQSSGRCQSFTFVEIPMLAEPNKINQLHLNADDNETDPLFHEPGSGGDESSGVRSPEQKTNGSVELRDQIDKNYETFVVRPYDESALCEESDTNKLECLICTKKFSTSLGLTIHQKEHTHQAKEFKCSVCPEFFDSYNLMATHYLQFHSSLEDVDNEEEAEQTDEELERAVHHLGFLTSKKCSICFKTFHKVMQERVGLSTYSQHIITDHSDNKELLKYFTYICSRCDKPHTFLHHLESHWKIHCLEKWKNEDGNNKQTIVCETCGLKFSNEISLSSHVKIFHSEKEKKKVICEQCGKEVANKNTLSQHIALVHHGQYTFNCEQCEKKFKTQSSLKGHIKKVHLKVKPFVCKFCSKCFSSNSCLSTHLNTHTGEKPYKCKYCDKSFGAPASLFNHEGSHTGFTCKMCTQSFTSYVELCGHKSQHHPTPNVADREEVGSDKTMEYPKQLKPTCKVCGETFNTYNIMRTHNLVVHEGRKYICDVCGKICTSINSFNYHKYTHDNLSKRFGCNLCGKQFGQSTNFYQHRKIAHPNQNAQIVKLTAETSFPSTEKVNKSTRGSTLNKERILPEVKSGQLSNAIQTSIATSEIETNPSLQYTEDQLQLDYNLDNSQGSENYSSDMDFADQDNENDIASLQQFDIAELRSVNPENAISVSDDVHNFSGLKLPTCEEEEATSGDQSVPRSCINFNDFSSSNVPLGLDTFSVDEVQPEKINTNIVSDKTVDKNEKQHQVFIEDSEAKGFLADFSVDDLLKLKTEGGVCDDDQSISSIQPYFSDAGGDDETAIEEKNGNRKSQRDVKEIVSSPFEYNSPRLVVKLTRLLEYKCAPCDKTIFATSRREIRHHSRAHRATNIRPKKKKRIPSENINCDFDCIYCEKKNLNSIQMIAHCSKEHPWQQPFQCNMCPKMFHNDDTLRRHKPQHNNDNYAGDPNVKPFWCKLCLKEFKTVEDAKEHFEHFHQNKMFQCDICPYSTVRKRQLKLHKVRHSGIKPHLCDECGKAFLTPHELTDHVERVHRKIDRRKRSKQRKEKSSVTHPFKCNLCPYVFMKENGLKLHLKLHDPKRKHVCDECGLRFIFNANLLDHKLHKHTKNGRRNIKVISTDA